MPPRELLLPGRCPRSAPAPPLPRARSLSFLPRPRPRPGLARHSPPSPWWRRCGPRAGSCGWRLERGESSSRPGERSRGSREAGTRAAAGGKREDGRRPGPRPPLLPPLLLPPLPRVRLLPPRLRAPDPAAARARASSSLPKICNLRVAPPTRSRHRYRSNLTPAPAGSASASNPSPPGSDRTSGCLPRAPGRRAPGPRTRVSGSLEDYGARPPAGHWRLE